MTSTNDTAEPTIRYSPRKRTKKVFRMDAYLRYSAEGDRDVEHERFQALREQRLTIDTWAKSRGVTILAWHDDSAVPAGSMRRPALDRALARARAGGETEGIVVAKLDRFSRAKQADAWEVVEELYKRGAVLAALDIEGCDPTTASGEWMMCSMLNMAHYQRKQIGERYASARATATRERHLYIASSTPVGYLRVNSDGEPVGPNTRAARLAAHPVEGPIIRELFERRASGESWWSLRDWLQSTGVRPQAKRKKVPDGRGGKVTIEAPRAEQWGINTVKRLVARRVYLGTVGDEHGGVYVDDAHPRLVDPETFKAAQIKRRPRHPHQGQLRSPLQGLVYCAGCSYKMGLHAATARQRPYFYCNRYRSAHDCTAAAQIAAENDRRTRVNGRFVGGSDADAPTSTWGLVDYVTEEMYARAGRFHAEPFDKDDRLEELRLALKQANDRLDEHADDDALRASVGQAAYDRKSERLRKRVDDLEVEIEPLEHKQPEALKMSVPDLRAAVESSIEEHHSALRMMVNGVFVRALGRERRGASAARVHIVWFNEGMPPVPRHGPDGGAGFPRSFVFPDLPSNGRVVAP